MSTEQPTPAAGRTAVVAYAIVRKSDRSIKKLYACGEFAEINLEFFGPSTYEVVELRSHEPEVGPVPRVESEAVKSEPAKPEVARPELSIARRKLLEAVEAHRQACIVSDSAINAACQSAYKALEDVMDEDANP